MAAKKKEDKEDREKRFEELLSELEGIVSALEAGAPDLEQSISAFERGMALSRECHKRLEEAERKIKLLKARSDCSVEETDFKDDDS